ncbi:MAG: DNA-binding protein [Nanoarchaeota archaeon]|nr:DNA-binding protein [Nanoarchaeota archaeon]
MNDKELARLLSDKELVEKKIESYIRKKALYLREKDKREIEGHISKAMHNLEFIQEISSKFGDWKLVVCYYASYHMALALALDKGYSSKSHDATLCILIKHYFKVISADEIRMLNEVWLDNEDLLFYAQSKNEREKASYSTRIIFDNANIEEIKLKTVLFVNKAKEILKD